MANRNFDMPVLVAAAAIGWLWGVGINPRPLALIGLIPVLWTLVGNRWLAGFVPAFYALSATRGLIGGSMMFFDRGALFGVILWLAAAVPHYCAGVLCWQRQRTARILCGIPLLCLVLALPPVMLVGWAHPLLAAGLWLPQLHPGWLALPGMLALMIIVSATLYQPRIGRCSFLLLAGGYAVAHYRAPTINTAPLVRAHQTRFAIGTYGAAPPDALTILRRHWQMQAMLDADSLDSLLDVFPESVGGNWDDYLAGQWQDYLRAHHPHKTVLMGAYRRNQGRPEGIIVAITANGVRTLYTQRLPMTGGMYNPFGTEANRFRAHWLGTSTAEVAGLRAGFAICFEHVVLWPMLQTTFSRPEIVIAPASIWWAPPQLQNAQRQSLRLWALWLGVPVIEAININGDHHDQ